MFYQLDDEIVSISAQEINKSILTIGYVSINELEQIYKQLGFSQQAFELCKKSEQLFSPRLELYDAYTLIRLDVNELDCHTAILLAKNLFIAVKPSGSKVNYRDIFMNIISRISCTTATEVKIIGFFLEELMDTCKKSLEDLQNRIVILEAAVLNERTKDDFNISLLEIKGELLNYREFYEQIIELCERLSENENDLLNQNELISLKSFSTRAERFKEKIDLLRNSVNHIWDSYQAQFDIKLNQSMKIFTLLTTIFFPITIIVGWYGMNFRFMPELQWKYGYIYVIALTIFIVFTLFLWLKRRKWL